jgi:hypothetical protein
VTSYLGRHECRSQAPVEEGNPSAYPTGGTDGTGSPGGPGAEGSFGPPRDYKFIYCVDIRYLSILEPLNCEKISNLIK